MRPNANGPRLALRAVRTAITTLLVGTIAVGVSVPADAASPSKDSAERRERAERRRLRDSGGKRGHVDRRNDVVPRRSHVDKKPGWRRID